MIRPDNVTILIVKGVKYRKANAVRKESGMEAPTIIAARRFCRKISTISMVNQTAENNASFMPTILTEMIGS
jgi:hypothetical protein